MNTDKIVVAIKKTLAALSESSAQYRRRESQLKMINDIRQILQSETPVAVCEAGTGVGKTLAYLLAVVPTAKAANKTVVVSTATVALQEQIIQKDLPLFQTVYPEPVTFALLKGKGRYVCEHKLMQALAFMQSNQQNLDFDWDAAVLTVKPEDADISTIEAMAMALRAGEWDGDRDAWSGNKLTDEVWSSIASDQYSCKHSSPSHARCPYHAARAQLQHVDVVVANHALVAADFALGGGVLLPSVEEAIYVFDEAHQLPEVVRDASAAGINLDGVLNVLSSLERVCQSQKLTRAFGDSTSSSASKELVDLVQPFIEDLERLKTWCQSQAMNWSDGQKYYRFESGRLPKSFETLTRNVESSGSRLVKCLKNTREALGELVNDANSLVLASAEQALSDIGFYLNRISAVLSGIKLLNVERDVGIPPAKWIDIDPLTDKVLLGASEVCVGESLRSMLWENHSGVVLTSATLRSLGSFHSFAQSVGLDYEGSAFFRRYASPFDYPTQAVLMTPLVPFEPNKAEFTVWLKAHLMDYIAGQKSTLVLFTSRKQMQEVRSAIESRCTSNGILLQCQGDAPRNEVIGNHQQALAKGLSSALFGLASFSEGLDLKGPLLENLIVIRLPFEMPDSPIAAAHSEYESRCGRRPFESLALPHASRALIQSVGRLIRSEQDTGRCVILDRRIVTKPYGYDLLSALPPFTRKEFEHEKLSK
ncbi:ATP-dependent DNA helicase DinG [Vibrio sp.]|uniref:ATP-dependent DNA helicase DinG n=1 Tax=Vibrio sp. TaxID=678 RepID=UPI003D12F34E